MSLIEIPGMTESSILNTSTESSGSGLRPFPCSSDRWTKHTAVVMKGGIKGFDTAKGRHDADGAIQRIPGYGKKVEPIVKDQLVNNSWPRFLHPYPLSDKYFLVSCQPTPSSSWGLYLVDTFDNMLFHSLSLFIP